MPQRLTIVNRHAAGIGAPVRRIRKHGPDIASAGMGYLAPSGSPPRARRRGSARSSTTRCVTWRIGAGRPLIRRRSTLRRGRRSRAALRPPRRRVSRCCEFLLSAQRQRLNDSPHPRLIPSGPFAARMFAPASMPAQSSVRWNDEKKKQRQKASRSLGDLTEPSTKRRARGRPRRSGRPCIAATNANRRSPARACRPSSPTRSRAARRPRARAGRP